uniref:Protein transport protein Sec61 subunit beta n=1 Tax=Salix viminalis TaxID=40686 RepID=A0A6N2MUH8_SALVM
MNDILGTLVRIDIIRGLRREMAVGGTAPPRGSAAAAASMRRRRTTSGGASGGAAGTMLQFYTDDAPGLKISPNVVLVMSIGFIAFVAILHVVGKLYLKREIKVEGEVAGRRGNEGIIFEILPRKDTSYLQGDRLLIWSSSHQDYLHE